MAEVLDRFRSSTGGWLRGTLAGWGTILLGVAGFILTMLAGGGALTLPGDISPLVPLVLTLAALGIVGWKWLVNLATTYEVTDDRLILRRGIFVKSIDEVELYRVKDVRLDFTLIGQMVRLGTISLTSSDETTRTTPLVMRDIDDAAVRRERLRGLVDTARQRRRVREIDMVHEDL